MKKLFLSFYILLVACAIQGATFYTDQFDDQKEIFIYSGGMSARCQAVRIAPEWFLTAAHCVYDYCKGKTCELQINLVQDSSFAVQAHVRHEASSPNIYIYDRYSPANTRSTGTDVALIHYNTSRTPTVYLDVLNGVSLSKSDFEKEISRSPEAAAQWRALAAKPSVKLLSFAGAPSARLKKAIAVPNVGGGRVDYLRNNSKEVYFVSPLQFLFSADFGVRPGNSGGGVWTEDGMLVGVVSQYLGTGPIDFYDENGSKIGVLANASNYFLFTGFTAGTMDFIRSYVPHVSQALAMGGYANSVDESFESITQKIDSARRAL